MANNIEPTFFSDDEMSALLCTNETNLANFLAGKVNLRIRKLKGALDAELARCRASEINYSRALAQIDGLKHTVEVLAGKRTQWAERDLYG